MLTTKKAKIIVRVDGNTQPYWRIMHQATLAFEGLAWDNTLKIYTINGEAWELHTLKRVPASNPAEYENYDIEIRKAVSNCEPSDLGSGGFAQYCRALSALFEKDGHSDIFANEMDFADHLNQNGVLVHWGQEIKNRYHDGTCSYKLVAQANIPSLIAWYNHYQRSYKKSQYPKAGNGWKIV